MLWRGVRRQSVNYFLLTTSSQEPVSQFQTNLAGRMENHTCYNKGVRLPRVTTGYHKGQNCWNMANIKKSSPCEL